VTDDRQTDRQTTLRINVQQSAQSLGLQDAIPPKNHIIMKAAYDLSAPAANTIIATKS